MEKVMSAFDYEPLILSQEPKTSDEEEDGGNNDGVGPLRIRTKKEELGHLKGGKDSPKREVGDKTCIRTDFGTNRICCARGSFQEYAFATIEIVE